MFPTVPSFPHFAMAAASALDSPFSACWPVSTDFPYCPTPVPTLSDSDASPFITVIAPGPETPISRSCCSARLSTSDRAWVSELSRNAVAASGDIGAEPRSPASSFCWNSTRARACWRASVPRTGSTGSGPTNRDML